MTKFKSPITAALVAAMLTITSPFAAFPIGQGLTCAQLADRLDGESRKFESDAQRQNIEFIHKDLFGHNDYEQAKATFEKLQGYSETLRNVYLCLAPGSSCKVNSLIEAAKGEVKSWLEGLTETGFEKARERALEAANLIDGYMKRVLSISTDTMTAMQQCTAPMPGQPKVDLNSVPPVLRVDENGLPEVKDPTPVPVKDGGGMGGMLALVGAAGGAVYGAQALGLLGGKCSAEAPNNYHSTCENQGRTTSTCLALQSEYQTWCDCQKRNFSYSGGCTSSK